MKSMLIVSCLMCVAQENTIVDFHTSSDALSTNGTSGDSNDPFGEFLAAPASQTTTSSSASNVPSTSPTPPTDSAKSDEENFFNQKLPEGGSDKLTKDSILALYGQAPSQPQPTTMFSVPSNMYMGGPSPGQPMAQPQPGMQNGAVMPQQQQNMMYMAQVTHHLSHSLKSEVEGSRTRCVQYL